MRGGLGRDRLSEGRDRKLGLGGPKKPYVEFSKAIAEARNPKRLPLPIQALSGYGDNLEN